MAPGAKNDNNKSKGLVFVKDAGRDGPTEFPDAGSLVTDRLRAAAVDPTAGAAASKATGVPCD